MKIETPQILWHNGSDSDNGKAAPLYSCSLLPVASNDNGNQSQRSVLATVGNTQEIHLWELTFSRNAETDQQHTNNGKTKHRILQPAVSRSAAHSNQSQKKASASTSINGGNNTAANNATGNTTGNNNTNTNTNTNTSANQPNQGQDQPDNLLLDGSTQIRHLFTISRQLDRSLNAVKFSPDGRHLAAAGDGGCVFVFTLPASAAGALTGGSNGKDGEAAAAAAAGTIWASLSEDGERSLRSKLLPSPSTHDVMDLSFSSDSKRLAVACLDHTVVVYENVTYTEEEFAALSSLKWSSVHRTSSDHVGYVQGVAFDPKNYYLASQGADRTVRVWSRKRKAVEKMIVTEMGKLSADINKTKSKGKGNVGGESDKGNNEKKGTGNIEEKAVAAAPDANEEKKEEEEDQGIDISDKDKTEDESTAKDGDSNSNKDSEEDMLTAQVKINLISRNALTDSKFELNKAKIIKFREHEPTGGTISRPTTPTPGAAATASDNTTAESSTEGNSNNNNKSSSTVSDNNPNAQAQSQPAARRHHLFGDESTVESFFRRLSWTPDGTFLIAPAAIWHCSPNANTAEKDTDTSDKSKDSGPSYATCLFSRHGFDQPCRVLAGLEKPSVVVRANPVLFQLPPSAASSNDGENADGNAIARTPSTVAPYRSIFAVLTLDSVVIYDTYHPHPLCLARGLHYAGLTDAAWSADGQTLLVTSTDGYISVLNFAEGELGVPAIQAVENRVRAEMMEEAAKKAEAKAKAAASSVDTTQMSQSTAAVVTDNATKVRADAISLTPDKEPAITSTAQEKIADKDVVMATEASTAAPAADAAQPNILLPKKKPKKRVSLKPVEQ